MMLNNSAFHRFTGKTNTKYVWWLNIGAENLWSEKQPGILPQIRNTGNMHTVYRTEQLCLLLAADGDIVIQREKPSDLLVYNLQRLNFGKPEIYVIENCSSNNEQCSISELILKDEELLRKLKEMNADNQDSKIELAPFAITHFEDEISLRSECPLIGAPANMTTWVNSKVNARILAEELELPVTEGYICYSVDEAKTAINVLKSDPDVSRIVIKEAYGASGKGMFVVDSEKDLHLLLTILNRKSNSGKAVELIVERWYDTAMDLNYQIYIDESGHISYIPPKRQINKDSIYIGSDFPIKDELTNGQKEYYEDCAMKIGQKLWKKGYWGFASIDSIITKDGTIIPIIEINGRLSLSTYISFIPEILGKEKNYRSKYYNLKSDITLEKLFKDIGHYNYSHENEEGIIIYSFAEGNPGISEGRLFVLFIAKTKERLYWLEEKFDRIADTI